MNEKSVSEARKAQMEIAEILTYLKDKGYEFSEREKGRIEQMLIDNFLHHTQTKNRLPNTT